MIDYSDTEAVIEECFNELQASSRERYDEEKANKTAALFLVAQMKVSFLVEEVEMKAKNAKNEISRLEGEKYFEFKSSSNEKKITDATVQSLVDKDGDIVKAKMVCSESEANLKKITYILNILKDGHVYFRNLSKNKTWSE